MIAVVGTPVPAITGMDVKGIAREIEARTGKLSLGFNTTGFNYYDSGLIAVGIALVDSFAETYAPIENTVNLIGTSPLDIGANGNDVELCHKFEDTGVHITMKLFMGTDINQIKKCSSASLNVATSAAGIKICEHLKKRFGTPFKALLPLGDSFGSKQISSLFSTCNQTNKISYKKGSGRLLILHDQVIGNSIRAALIYYGATFEIDVASFFAMNKSFCEPNDIFLRDESQYIEILKSHNYTAIMGDPMVTDLPYTQNMLKFDELHPAVSGKQGWNDVSSFFTTEYEKKLKDIVEAMNCKI